MTATAAHNHSLGSYGETVAARHLVAQGMVVLDRNWRCDAGEIDLVEAPPHDLLPVLSKLPIKFLYPTGKKQEEVTPRYGRYYAWADALAGDFHLIRRFMPGDLRGKLVLTQTVTPTDVEELRRRGVWLLKARR